MALFRNLSFRVKVLSMVTFAASFCAAIAIVLFIQFHHRMTAHGIKTKQAAIHRQLEAATGFVGNQGGLASTIEKFIKKYQTVDQLTESDKVEILNQVPIYAAMKIGAQNAEFDQYVFRVFSDKPRNEKYKATSEELKIFQQFLEDESLPEIITHAGDTITTYKPVRLTEAQGCFTCHGSPSKSPWGDGTDILGYKMEDWSEGKLHGVFAVSQSVTDVVNAENAGSLLSPEWWLILAIAAGAILSILVAAVSIRQPLRNLTEISKALGESSGELTDASEQIANSSQALSQATTEQAASLAETAASIEQMTAMIGKNSDNAADSAKVSVKSKARANEGQSVVQEMIGSMEKINHSNETIMRQIETSNLQMAEIANVIQEIGTKTKVINDIVFQTKLLSFNASVEAARAGEHGKGFAVVAEEVGNLAEMSGSAANEISSMLEESIKKVESIVEQSQSKMMTLMKEGKSAVAVSDKVARQCGQVLIEIVNDVSEVSRMANEISIASREQAQGIHELNKAMNQLDEVTQLNAKSGEETAKAGDRLSSQAQSLRGFVTRLVAILNGGGNTTS